MSSAQKKKIAKSVANYHANACRKWESKYRRLKSQVAKTPITRYKSRQYKNTKDMKYEGTTSKITRVAPGGGKIVKQKLADRKKADKKKADKQKRKMYKVIKEKKLNTATRKDWKALVVKLKKEGQNKDRPRGSWKERDRIDKLAKKIYALAKKSGDIKPVVSGEGGDKKVPYFYEAVERRGIRYKTYWKAIGINLALYK